MFFLDSGLRKRCVYFSDFVIVQSSIHETSFTQFNTFENAQVKGETSKEYSERRPRAIEVLYGPWYSSLKEYSHW